MTNAIAIEKNTLFMNSTYLFYRDKHRNAILMTSQPEMLL